MWLCMRTYEQNRVARDCAVAAKFDKDGRRGWEARMLRMIGAGLGRTGTNSLKLALERLLDAPCYHMIEVNRHPEHAQVWLDALLGRPEGLDGLLAGYVATVDWPGAALWRLLAARYPQAVVLLSLREDAATWLRSARATVMPIAAPDWHQDPGWRAMRDLDEAMFAALDPHWRDDTAAMAAYDRHAESVRRNVAPERLVEWRPGDGWQPLCKALRLPVPDEPFPHVNSTAEFLARLTGQHTDDRQHRT
jgi:sulfotransferase family protein